MPLIGQLEVESEVLWSRSNIGFGIVEFKPLQTGGEVYKIFMNIKLNFNLAELRTGLDISFSVYPHNDPKHIFRRLRYQELEKNLKELSIQNALKLLHTTS